MHYFLFAFLFVSTPISADVCLDTSSLALEWEAFKTPLKVGVKGSFSKIKWTKSKNKSSSLETLLSGTVVEIDTNSLETGDPSRDKNVLKFFFKEVRQGNSIKASVTRAGKKMLWLEIELNKKKVKVPMVYKTQDQKIEAKGHIDLIDFALGDALKSLNSACKALHQGKTWNDVALTVKANWRSC